MTFLRRFFKPLAMPRVEMRVLFIAHPGLFFCVVQWFLDRRPQNIHPRCRRCFASARTHAALPTHVFVHTERLCTSFLWLDWGTQIVSSDLMVVFLCQRDLSCGAHVAGWPRGHRQGYGGHLQCRKMHSTNRTAASSVQHWFLSQQGHIGCLGMLSF